MLDIHFLTENKSFVLKQLSKRNDPSIKTTIDHLLNLNQQRKSQQKKANDEAHALRISSKAFQAALIKKEPEIEILRLTLQKQKQRKLESEQKLKKITHSYQQLMASLPNIPHEEIPIGKNATANRIIQEGGPPCEQAGSPHWELLKEYDLVDFEKGNRVAGAGFPIYKKAGAKLLRGVIQWLLDRAIASGYQEYIPPLLANRNAAFGTGQLPDKGGVMYGLKDDSFFLIPTAEVPLTNLYGGQILSKELLPLKLTAHTACFRREAGSWGREVRGLNRLRQFDKIELVELHTNRKSALTALQKMCSYAISILEELQLPYRLVDLCAADLGHSAARTYDIEIWARGQQKWLEISSMSHFESYQARRIPLRYRAEDGKVAYCHTLNGSAFGIPRLLIGILEQYQQEERIDLPSCLHPYIGKSYLD